jgi:hypothetical protein
MLTEHLLCAKHCANAEEALASKMGQASALPELQLLGKMEQLEMKMN